MTSTSHGKQQDPPPNFEISVQELKKRLDRKDPFHLVDVREPYEHAIARIESATLIPLGDIPKRYVELDKKDEIILICRSGVRSFQALEFLRTQGFSKLKNVTGGITAWSIEIDPTVPRY